MCRVFIIGPPGSGKTTISTLLSENTEVKKFSLDDIFWKENWEATALDEFKNQVINIVENNNFFIIEGDYIELLEMLESSGAVVLCINRPLPILLYNVLKRYFISLMKNQPVCGPNKESFKRMFKRDGMLNYTIKRHKFYKRLKTNPTLDIEFERITKLKDLHNIEKYNKGGTINGTCFRTYKKI
jgi:adenylate kinase family enzyme